MQSSLPAPAGLAAGKRSFWRRPEGVPGLIFGLGILIGGGWALYKALPYLITLASNLLYLAGMLLVLGAVIYMVLDPKMRNLVWYLYKSMMRGLTGIFVKLNPISILKSYVEDLEKNLANMSTQIGVLSGQKRKLEDMRAANEVEIKKCLQLASAAKRDSNPDNDNMVVIKTRQASRLEEVNKKYDILLQKMDILKKVLSKMYKNSEVVLEDLKDEIKMKEQEYKAIKASHSAMTSAMNIIRGETNSKEMFDTAMEHIADDMALKVGEMEQFMENTHDFMKSIDLQNGVFEEEGLKMLEKWEENSSILKLTPSAQTLKLGAQRPEKVEVTLSDNGSTNQYDQLFKS